MVKNNPEPIEKPLSASRPSKDSGKKTPEQRVQCCFVCPVCGYNCTQDSGHELDHMCTNGHQWN